MKIKSVQYVFDCGAVVTFIKGSKEVYNGNQVAFKGKNYFYDVTIEHSNGVFTTNTFQSPSQVVASEMLVACLRKQSITACS